MGMVPIHHKKITLYEEAKAGLRSLVQQTVTVFISFVFMLLFTGGAPSGFIVGLSFCLGTAFVAWSEQRRITKMRVQSLSNYSEVSDKNVQSNGFFEVTFFALCAPEEYALEEYVLEEYALEELVSQPTKMGEIKYAKSIEEIRRINEVTRLDKENWKEEDRERKIPRGSFGYIVPWTHDYGKSWSPVRVGTATVEVHHSKNGQMYVVGFVNNRTLTRLLDPSGDGEITIKISWEISKSFCEVVAISTNKIVSIDRYHRHPKDFKSKKIDYEKSWDKQDTNKNDRDSDWNREDWDENIDYSIMIINKYKNGFE
jgi:hypothetical protein